MPRRERVAVTGLGLITPIGTGRETVWAGLLAGRCGTGPVRAFDATPYGVDRGAEVTDFEPDALPDDLDPASLGRASQLAVVAARMALHDADPEGPPELDPARCGVVMGTTSGEPIEVERFIDAQVAGALERIGPELMGRYPCHLIAAHVATAAGYGGLNAMIPTACAAGNYAIAYAYDVLATGRADRMLAGGADAFSRITYAGFARLGAIAPDRCRPFRPRPPGHGAG